jgi:multidrug efflux pump subunit AcrB
MPDRDKMASLGVTLGGLGLALNNAFSGNADGKFREGRSHVANTYRKIQTGFAR